MKISLNTFYQPILSIKEKIFSFTPQQKKIAIIVSLAFACLAVAYLVIQRFFPMNVRVRDEEGVITEGKFINGKLNGQGKKTFKNKMVEEGQFKDDELHGKGKRICTDKSIQDGEFEEGLLIRGTISGSGFLREGQFAYNQLSGPGGKLKMPSGKVYEGTFQRDQLHGQGKVINADGTVAEEGTFEKGILIPTIN